MSDISTDMTGMFTTSRDALQFVAGCYILGPELQPDYDPRKLIDTIELLADGVDTYRPPAEVVRTAEAILGETVLQLHTADS